MFDIKDFYSSMSISLLTSSLNFVETKLSISAEGRKNIYHANQEQAWIASLEKSFDKRCSVVSGMCNITRMVRLEIDTLV